MVNRDTLRRQGIHDAEQPIARSRIGSDIGDLRSDMAVDTAHFQRVRRRCMTVHLERGGLRHAKLVLSAPRRDVAMRPRVHVRIHAHGDRSDEGQEPRPCFEPLELGRALHVEAADARLEGEIDLRHRLADAREDDVLSRAAGPQHPLEFARGHDVETGPEIPHQAQDRQVGVRLDGVADANPTALESSGKALVAGLDGRRRIDVGGRAHGVGYGAEGNVFDPDGVVDATEHAALRLSSGDSSGSSFGRYSGPLWPHVAAIAHHAAARIQRTRTRCRPGDPEAAQYSAPPPQPTFPRREAP